jgi:hypothetical protein
MWRARGRGITVAKAAKVANERRTVTVLEIPCPRATGSREGSCLAYCGPPPGVGRILARQARQRTHGQADIPAASGKGSCAYRVPPPSVSTLLPVSSWTVLRRRRIRRNRICGFTSKLPQYRRAAAVFGMQQVVSESEQGLGL